MQSSPKPTKELDHYYIVCKPISYNKALNKDDLAAVFKEVLNKFPKEGNVYNVFVNEEQAKLEASQFSSMEVPNFFNKQYAKKHNLAKPILCLALDYPITLTDRAKSIYFMKGQQLEAISCRTTVDELRQWQDTDFAIMLDGKQYKFADLHENKQERSNCLVM